MMVTAILMLHPITVFQECVVCLLVFADMISIDPGLAINKFCPILDYDTVIVVFFHNLVFFS